MRVKIHHGDCLDVLAAMPDAWADSVVTDPPYSLGFMGRAWDTHDTPAAFAAWCEAWARECFRVLKPGGHLLAFGGTRTAHRLTCGIEDAGFEIRDAITWLYGSGFPKSLDVGKAIDKAAGATREVVGRSPDAAVRRAVSFQTHDKPTGYTANPEGDRMITAPATDAARQWDGWGTALKPASEPIVVARKPLSGTVAQTVLQHGTGALNIDASRVVHASPADLAVSLSKNPGRVDAVTSGVYGADRPQQSVNGAGRWPANVVLSHAATPDGADLCGEGCVPGCPVADLDAQSGVSKTNRPGSRSRAGEGWGMDAQAKSEMPYYGDTGGASRFFPTFRYQAKAPARERPRVEGVAHPTVKPLALMRWLVTLVTPPGGVVLEPFAGSGTTVEAALTDGFGCVAIERDASYLPLIEQRIERVRDGSSIAS